MVEPCWPRRSDQEPQHPGTTVSHFIPATMKALQHSAGDCWSGVAATSEALIMYYSISHFSVNSLTGGW